MASEGALTVSLRRVRPEDVGAVAALQLATALEAYADVFPAHAPKPTVDQMAERWSEIVGVGLGWLAEVDGEIAGIAALMPEGAGAHLEAVYVNPRHWSHGIGSALVDAAEAEAVRRPWLPLRLWVLEANHPARRWYENRGWRPEPGRRRTVWGDIDDIGYELGEEGIDRWQA